MCRNMMLEAEVENRETMEDFFLKLWEAHLTNYKLYLDEEELASLPKQTIEQDFLLFINEELKEERKRI